MASQVRKERWRVNGSGQEQEKPLKVKERLGRRARPFLRRQVSLLNALNAYSAYRTDAGYTCQAISAHAKLGTCGLLYRAKKSPTLSASASRSRRSKRSTARLSGSAESAAVTCWKPFGISLGQTTSAVVRYRRMRKPGVAQSGPGGFLRNCRTSSIRRWKPSWSGRPRP